MKLRITWYTPFTRCVEFVRTLYVTVSSSHWIWSLYINLDKSSKGSVPFESLAWFDRTEPGRVLAWLIL